MKSTIIILVFFSFIFSIHPSLSHWWQCIFWNAFILFLKSQVDILLEDVHVDKRDYFDNGEWEIVKTTGSRGLRVDLTGSYPFITYSFIIRRLPLFYTLFLIIPCIGLSFLTVLVFYLPSNCGEKISLCTYVLVSLTVFLLVIEEIIPSSSKVWFAF